VQINTKKCVTLHFTRTRLHLWACAAY